MYCRAAFRVIMDKLRAKETMHTYREASEMPARYRGSVERVINMYDMDIPTDCTTYGESNDILSELNTAQGMRLTALFWPPTFT